MSLLTVLALNGSKVSSFCSTGALLVCEIRKGSNTVGSFDTSLGTPKSPARERERMKRLQLRLKEMDLSNRQPKYSPQLLRAL